MATRGRGRGRGIQRRGPRQDGTGRGVGQPGGRRLNKNTRPCIPGGGAGRGGGKNR